MGKPNEIHPSRVSKVSSAATAILIARIASIAAGAIQLPIIAHMLSKAEFSTVSSGIALSVIVGLIGFESTILAFQRFPKDKANRDSYTFSFRRLLIFTLSLLLPLTMLALIGGDVTLLMSIACWGCGLAWVRFVSTAWLMWNAPWKYSLSLIVSTSIRTILFVGGVALHLGPEISLCVGGLGSMLATFVVSPKPKGLIKSLPLPWPKYFGLSLALASTGVTILSGVDKMFAPWIIGKVQAAQYLAMSTLATLTLGSILSIINTTYFPRVIHSWSKAAPHEVSREILLAFRSTVILSCSTILITLVLGNSVLRYIFPEHLINIKLLLSIYTATSCIAIGLLYSWVFQLHSNAALLRSFSLYAALLSTLIVPIMGFALGAKGLAIGMILGGSAYACLLGSYTNRGIFSFFPIFLLSLSGILSLSADSNVFLIVTLVLTYGSLLLLKDDGIHVHVESRSELRQS